MALSDEAKREMEAAFKSFDKDGSGTLSATDLAKAMNTISGGLSEAQCIELISLADSDGDKKMNFEEFMKIVEEGLALYEEQNPGADLISEEFKNFDVNGDGVIDKDELRQAMLDMGEEVREEELEAMFRAADADGDQKISVEEFRKMCGH
ncbi:hypothetical protein ACHWQZ_G012206 [Mnemiopsis leidyi]